MNTKDVLKDARALVEKGWCQNVGRWRNQFCAIGAVIEVGGLRISSACDLLNREARELGYSSMVRFNDSPMTTQADVLDLFDRAIARPLFVKDGIGWTTL